MKIILSFLILLSLAFLVPSDAFANDGYTIAEVESLEHDTADGTYKSLVQVDANTYALAYAGGDGGTGFISTFTISADGTGIAEVATLEHDTALGLYNSLVQVDANTYALAYAGGDGGTGFISTFTISADGTGIAEVATLEHDTALGEYNSLVQVDANTYALAYAGDENGFISTFTISADGTGIAEVATLEHDTALGLYNSLVQVDANTYALAYAGGDGGTGFISTFTISADGTGIAEVATLEHDTANGEYNSLVQVDANTYALAYAGGDGGTGFISTFTISADGTGIAEVATLEHDTALGEFNSLVQVDANTYALAYAGDGYDGFISTFTISADGTGIAEVATLEHDTALGEYKSLVQVDANTYALAYAGDENGFISTFTIDVPSLTDTEKKSSSDCYDCEAPKLTKVEVHITSQNSDTQRISTSSEIWHFDQKSPYPMFGDTITPIVADPGDEIEIILELTDNRTLKRVYDSGTYTNFLTKPNDMNTFYANNFDEYGKVSTTYYEWHQTGEDLVYDYDNTVEWSDVDVTIEESAEFVEGGQAPNLDGLVGTFTISFKMKFLQPMQTSDVWVQATDRSGNFFKVALPLTLKISGNEPLLFESKIHQKVLSFYDESMLYELVSDWTGSSQDVSELTAVLGIPDEQLPSWVTNLAVWVSEDKITLAHMIVSIEHLINN